MHWKTGEYYLSHYHHSCEQRLKHNQKEIAEEMPAGRGFLRFIKRLTDRYKSLHKGAQPAQNIN